MSLGSPSHTLPDFLPSFRPDVPVHGLLTKPCATGPIVIPKQESDGPLPQPVLPQHPELLASEDNYEQELERAKAGERHPSAPLILKYIREVG